MLWCSHLLQDQIQSHKTECLNTLDNRKQVLITKTQSNQLQVQQFTEKNRNVNFHFRISSPIQSHTGITLNTSHENAQIFLQNQTASTIPNNFVILGTKVSKNSRIEPENIPTAVESGSRRRKTIFSKNAPINRSDRRFPVLGRLSWLYLDDILVIRHFRSFWQSLSLYLDQMRVNIRRA